MRSLLLVLLVLRVAAVGCFTLLPCTAGAAEALTLEKALEEGRAHSPVYLRAQAVADEASARAFEAMAGYLPRLSVGANRLLAFRYQTIPLPAGFGAPGAEFSAIIPQTTLSLGVNINLFDGFQTTNTYRAARLVKDAAQRDAARVALQLEDDIRLRYFEALAAQLLAEVADQNVKTLQDHLNKAKALLRGGGATKLDTLRVDVQLSEAIPEQISARDNVALTRAALSETVGIENDARPLEGVLPIPDSARLPADLKLEATQRDDLQALAARADAAAKIRLAAKSVWFPRINFMAETQYYNSHDSSWFDSDQFRNAYTVGLNLSWSIFDAGAIARSQVISAQQIEAESTMNDAMLRAPLEFDRWKRRFLSNVQLYKARTHAIESAQEGVRLAHLGYEAGTRTSTDLLDTELDLFRARAGAVRAQLEAGLAFINLELAVGHHL
jgi:outer membrane protein TolC